MSKSKLTAVFRIKLIFSSTVDNLIQQIKTEMDEKKRNDMIHEALQIVKNDYNYLPLHDQIRPWAMRKGVTTLHRADDRPMPQWTTIK